MALLPFKDLFRNTPAHICTHPHTLQHCVYIDMYALVTCVHNVSDDFLCIIKKGRPLSQWAKIIFIYTKIHDSIIENAAHLECH